MTNIYKSRNYKGIYFVNGKTISLSDYRLSKRNDLNDHEMQSFEDYLKAEKLI